MEESDTPKEGAMTEPNEASPVFPDMAFPIVVPAPGFQHYEMGLTKREYFAACALQGVLTKEEARNTGVTYSEFALDAVRFADALIKALNNGE